MKKVAFLFLFLLAIPAHASQSDQSQNQSQPPTPESSDQSLSAGAIAGITAASALAAGAIGVGAYKLSKRLRKPKTQPLPQDSPLQAPQKVSGRPDAEKKQVEVGTPNNSARPTAAANAGSASPELVDEEKKEAEKQRTRQQLPRSKSFPSLSVSPKSEQELRTLDDSDVKQAQQQLFQVLTSTDKKKPNLERAEQLLNQGADVNGVDYNGATALHYAVMSDNIATVKFLIEHGANINAKTKAETSPLDLAKDKSAVKQYLEGRQKTKARVQHEDGDSYGINEMISTGETEAAVKEYLSTVLDPNRIINDPKPEHQQQRVEEQKKQEDAEKRAKEEAAALAELKNAEETRAEKVRILQAAIKARSAVDAAKKRIAVRKKFKGTLYAVEAISHISAIAKRNNTPLKKAIPRVGPITKAIIEAIQKHQIKMLGQIGPKNISTIIKNFRKLEPIFMDPADAFVKKALESPVFRKTSLSKKTMPAIPQKANTDFEKLPKSKRTQINQLCQILFGTTNLKEAGELLAHATLGIKIEQISPEEKVEVERLAKSFEADVRGAASNMSDFDLLEISEFAKKEEIQSLLSTLPRFTLNDLIPNAPTQEAVEKYFTEILSEIEQLSRQQDHASFTDEQWTAHIQNLNKTVHQDHAKFLKDKNAYIHELQDHFAALQSSSAQYAIARKALDNDRGKKQEEQLQKLKEEIERQVKGENASSQKGLAQIKKIIEKGDFSADQILSIEITGKGNFWNTPAYDAWEEAKQMYRKEIEEEMYKTCLNNLSGTALTNKIDSLMYAGRSYERIFQSNPTRWKELLNIMISGKNGGLLYGNTSEYNAWEAAKQEYREKLEKRDTDAKPTENKDPAHSLDN